MAVPIPTAMRPSIIGGFARTVNADMSEAVDPDFSNYSTLSDFFTRHLKTGARTFDEHGTSKTQLFSPCDGNLSQIAELTDRSGIRLIEIDLVPGFLVLFRFQVV